MQLNEAAAMLDHDYFRTTEQMVWADLGCGSGTFTLALASLLSPGSFVYAIDRNAAALQQIPSGYNWVSIKNTSPILSATGCHCTKLTEYSWPMHCIMCNTKLIL